LIFERKRKEFVKEKKGKEEKESMKEKKENE
jgi:hypothetical protein